MRDVAGGHAGNNRHMWRIGRAGQRIGGRYRLVERLGTGGMSVVWRGYDEILGREVAVKVLSPQLAGDVAFRDRLRQEALAAARLCHPNLTGIFDFGESPLSGQLTVPYVVMELNHGESVSARLRRTGALPWRDAVVVAVEVASALATAHARGVVHRDITPANIMLTPAGAKVVDFGISALIGQCDATPDGSLLGTPAYLAPERLGGGQVLPATDVYALGLLLYRLLTARLPWPAGNTTEALRAHLYADPEPLPAQSGRPDEVAEVCLRCLAKHPEDRPGAAEVANALAAFVGLKPIGAPARARTPVRPAYAASPGPAGSVRRLRAMLRIGSALRVGRVQPLGGGLFVGGRLARDVLTGGRIGRAVCAGNHRLQAALATVTLLAVVGLSWSATRPPAQVRPAQAAAAAGPGAAAVALRHPECRVRYQVKRDSGRDFEAQLTLSNTGAHALSGWRLEFAYPGSQRISAAPKRVVQSGREVVVHGKANGKLDPGRSLTVPLRGGYREVNPMPLAFVLNGHACESTVIGATTGPGADPADDGSPKVAEAAGTDRSRSGSGGAAARSPDAPKKAPRHKTTTKTGEGTRKPAPARPVVPKRGAYSVAI